MDGQKNGWTDETDNQTYGLTDGETNNWRDEWVGGWAF